MSEPSEHELAAADAYAKSISRPVASTHGQRIAFGVGVRKAFLAGIDWNETRCRVCDTVECGTWYCHKCHKLVEHGTPAEQAAPELLAACKAVRDCCKKHGGKLSPHASVLVSQAIAAAEPTPATKGKP